MPRTHTEHDAVGHLAVDAEHAIRQLTHRTRPATGELADPSDAADVIAALAATTWMLPQLLGQLARWIQDEHHAQRLRVDDLTPIPDPGQTVQALASTLQHASQALLRAAAELDTAHQHAAHLAAADPDTPARARGQHSCRSVGPNHLTKPSTGNLRPGTGWCGPCSHPGPPTMPPRTCPQCGATTNRLSNGVCNRCWQAHPDRPFTRAATLAAELPETPDWFDGFVAHVASVHCPARAAGLIGKLGLLLADGASTHPQALLERSRQPGRSMGSLGRALETFFTSQQLALPTDQDQRLAEGRRNRRITATPEQFRPAVANYSESMLAARVRAARAHTKPRSDSTIEGSLAVVRDLAVFLTGRGRTDWAQVTGGDVEAFLTSRRPGNRPRTLTVIGQFFRWARTNKLILVDPTHGIVAARRRGFNGPTITVDRQRLLFRRWTTDATAHPHEAFVGLLAMLHGATNLEIRQLRILDIDHSARTIQLGSRPHRTPLDPPTWAALQRCISHREQWSTTNPHLLVTKQTKGQLRPASMPYLAHVLDPAGVAPKKLRVTRLAELVNTLDPKLVAAAFGMKPEGVLDYLADHVDPGRIPEELANPSAFGAT